MLACFNNDLMLFIKRYFKTNNGSLQVIVQIIAYLMFTV